MRAHRASTLDGGIVAAPTHSAGQSGGLGGWESTWETDQDSSTPFSQDAPGSAPTPPAPDTAESLGVRGSAASSDDWYGTFCGSGYYSDDSTRGSVEPSEPSEHYYAGPNSPPFPREEHDHEGASNAAGTMPLQQTLQRKRPAEDEEHTVAEEAQSMARTGTDSLPPSEIYKILNSGGECPFVPRPDFITSESAGRIFVERASGRPEVQKIRRRKGVDQWRQRMELTPKIVPGATCGKDGKGEVWVKSSYGKVIRAGPTGGDDIGYRYHMHQLHYFYRGRAAAEALAEQQALKKLSLAATRARKDGASTGAPKRMRQAVKAPVAQPDWIQGTLFHLRGPAAKGTSQAPTDSARLELRLNPGEKRWIQFVDEHGETKGGVDLGSKGPRFSAASGDFAEYHPRDPTQQPFEEGDLVGFGPAGLTRKTKGSCQLGVITRQAIVVGSAPAESDLSGWDTVAYIGRVPVKLLGGAKRDDFLTPSGKEDGTAVATSGVPDITIGRALHDHAELDAAAGNDSSPEPRSTWQFVEASVVPPVQTVRPDQTKWHQIQVVSICCGMTALVVAAEFAGRQMRLSSQPSTPNSLLAEFEALVFMPPIPSLHVAHGQLALSLLKLALILGSMGAALHKWADVYPRAARRLCLQAASTWPCTMWPKIASTLLQYSNEPQTGSPEQAPLSTQAQTGDTDGRTCGAISTMDAAVHTTAPLEKANGGQDDESRDAVLDEVLRQHIGRLQKA